MICIEPKSSKRKWIDAIMIGFTMLLILYLLLMSKWLQLPLASSKLKNWNDRLKGINIWILEKTKFVWLNTLNINR